MKKKILFLINTLRDGGAEKILVDIVNNLDPGKYDVEVRLIYNRNVFGERLNNNIKLTYIVENLCSIKAKIVSRLLPIMSSEVLHFLFISGKYDIEIAFLEGYATKIIAGASKYTRKLAWVHCDVTKAEWINGVFSSEQGFIDCYKKIDEVVAVSESVKAAFVTRFGPVTELSVRYNPVDNREIRKLAEQPIDILPSSDRITLISLGRMMYPKNFMRLLRAFNNLINEGYLIELWLLGTGEEYNKLSDFVISNNLKEQVKFLGFKKNPYAYMKRADLYVCSSIYEGFSTAATEALVLGIPVLTTEVSGMREMLGDNEYGLITDNTDEEFEAGLRMVVSDEKLLNHYKEKALERGAYFEFAERMEEIREIFN